MIPDIQGCGGRSICGLPVGHCTSATGGSQIVRPVVLVIMGLLILIEGGARLVARELGTCVMAAG